MKQSVPMPVAAGIAVAVLAVLFMVLYRVYLAQEPPEALRVGPSAMGQKPSNVESMSDAERRKIYTGGH